MTDAELMASYIALECPAGSRAEIDLDADEVGCFTESGDRVPPLSAPVVATEAGLGVIGYSAIISAGLLIAAVVVARKD